MPDDVLEGRPCPCAEDQGWRCQYPEAICVRDPADAQVGQDAGPDADGGPNGDDAGESEDGGVVDAGGDSGTIDAGPSDAGPFDAGPFDTGPPDLGLPDPTLRLWLPCETDLLDASRHSVTATCTGSGCPSVGTFEGRQACEFDGVDDDLEVSATELLVDQEHTLSAWVRLLSTADYPHVFGRPYGTGTDNTYELYVILLSGIPNFAYKIDDGTSVEIYEPATDVLDRWVHLAATYDGAIMSLYIDGAFVSATARDQPLYDASPLLIGADEDSGVRRRRWTGWLADLRVYDRALARAEVAALAAE